MVETDKKSSTQKATAAKISKRKAASSKKTSKVKTKITKGEVKDVKVTAIKETETTKERTMTARRQRIITKAQSKPESIPVVEPVEVEAVKITDVAGVVYDKAVYDSMVEMYDSTIKDIKEGEIIHGSVISVNQEAVIVDVGFKSEGLIPIHEFPKPLNIKVGEEIDVFLEQIEDSNGQVLLSKQKADFMLVWDKIRDMHDAGETVDGRVMRRIKGGVIVDVMGVDSFLPGSQISLRQVPDFDALIGQTMALKIIKINKSRRNIVVSRRVVLEKERESMRDDLLSEIEVGQVRQGVVKNVTDFGVFIDMGGVDGLLHITDMSWGRVRHPSEMVNLGENIDVKILDFDERTTRISLGLKQMTPYPWEDIELKYPVNKKISGKVVSITDYGAFIELEKGIEGLIHISEMSWTQHIKHPSKIMSVGDKVDAVVLSVDKDNEKISLGIKQMEPDPWLTIEGKYPISKILSGKVRNLTAFGAFVELEAGIDGLVHISDMSWTKRIQHPSEVMKKGDVVDVKVIRIDNENRRISLGFKQLIEDPWPVLAEKLAVGTESLGTIVKVFDRGVVVDLGDSVEGFVPTSQLGDKELTDPTSAFNEGEQLNLQVIEFDQSLHKVVLSALAYYKKRDKAEFEEYLTKHSVATSTPPGDSKPDEVKAKAKTSVEETPAKAEAVEKTPEDKAEAVPESSTEEASKEDDIQDKPE